MKKTIIFTSIMLSAGLLSAQSIVVPILKDRPISLEPKAGIFIPFNSQDPSVMFGGEVMKQISNDVSIGVSVMAGEVNLKRTERYTVEEQTGMAVSQECSSEQVCTEVEDEPTCARVRCETVCTPNSHLECETVETCVNSVTPITKTVTKEKSYSYTADTFIVMPTVRYAVSKAVAVEGGVGYASVDSDDCLAFTAGVSANTEISEHVSLRGHINYLNLDKVDGLIASLGVQYSF